jgi:uncharacterized protein (DUF2236 family)
VTVDLLPPRIREEHGLDRSPAREILFGASALASKNVLPLLPDLLRSMLSARVGSDVC